MSERLTPEYKKYQEDVCRYYQGEHVTSTNIPSLEAETVEGGFFKFIYHTITIEPLHSQASQSTDDSTNPSMVYRNNLWLKRLNDNILPEIKGNPFILVVGYGHKFVEDQSEKIGVHDYFQKTFGENCLKPIKAEDIPNVLH